jgi:hypothetical protein
MKTEERKIFAQEAKQLAEQHRKIHPDCWKRKRSISGVSLNWKVKHIKKREIFIALKLANLSVFEYTLLKFHICYKNLMHNGFRFGSFCTI